MTALRIGDEPLAPAAVAAAAREERVDVELTPAARERIAAGRRMAEEIAARQPVYGFTTAVGANRHVELGDDLRAQSLRLLRSHAGGAGDPLPDDAVRATILVRLAQVAAGGGGHRPEMAGALAAVLRDGPLPRLRDLGGIGTGDLTVLGQLGLALAGEGDDAPPPRLTIEAGDALPLMSSNAATLGTAVLAWAEVAELLDAALGVAALSFHALEGNREAFAAPVPAARPLPGLAAVSERLWALTEGAPPPARIQDPLALRCLPPVAAALHDGAARLHDLLAIEINAATENPLFVDGEVLHHGGFHAAGCALALDGLRLALVPFAALASARLSHLMAPELTGLPPFLSDGEPGSSGLLIAEYLAADALARLRAEAAPAVPGAAVIARGQEEHASFAWQGAGQARRAAGHLRTVIALEWIAAERALRMKGAGAGAAEVLRRLAATFDHGLEDQPLGEDVARARAALAALAGAVRAVAARP
jgi:histidine ammonia-lyase